LPGGEGARIDAERLVFRQVDGAEFLEGGAVDGETLVSRVEVGHADGLAQAARDDLEEVPAAPPRGGVAEQGVRDHVQVAQPWVWQQLGHGGEARGTQPAAAVEEGAAHVEAVGLQGAQRPGVPLSRAEGHAGGGDGAFAGEHGAWAVDEVPLPIELQQPVVESEFAGGVVHADNIIRRCVFL
jgi:hypothetical protein